MRTILICAQCTHSGHPSIFPELATIDSTISPANTRSVRVDFGKSSLLNRNLLISLLGCPLKALHVRHPWATPMNHSTRTVVAALRPLLIAACAMVSEDHTRARRIKHRRLRSDLGSAQPTRRLIRATMSRQACTKCWRLRRYAPADRFLNWKQGEVGIRDSFSGTRSEPGKLIIQRPPQLADGALQSRERIDAGRISNATVTRECFRQSGSCRPIRSTRFCGFSSPHELYFTPRNATWCTW